MSDEQPKQPVLSIKEMENAIDAGFVSGVYELGSANWDDDFENVCFQNCTISNGSFSCSVFKDCSFKRVHFKKCGLDCVNFIHCEFDECVFDDYGPSHITFENCRIIKTCRFEERRVYRD